MATLVKFPNNSHLNLTIMARLQGISGGMSGKTGSFTYRQSRGQTIVSQYQPSVKNPNTAGQQAQRAKFKLMSQLAAVLSPGFGTMGINERPARQRPTTRNAFVSLNMPKCETTIDESTNTVAAKVIMDELSLTSSSRYLGEISQANGVVSVNVADTSITQVRFVLIGYINNDITQPVLKAVAIEDVDGAVAQYTNTATGEFTVLAYGLIPTASSSSASLDNLHMVSASEAAVVLSNMVASGDIVETETIGITYTNA